MYINIPYGNRTRVSALKKRCPRPLDEKDSFLFYFLVPSEGSTLPCEAPPSEGGAYFGAKHLPSLPCKAGLGNSSLNFPANASVGSKEVLPTYRRRRCASASHGSKDYRCETF